MAHSGHHHSGAHHNDDLNDFEFIDTSEAALEQRAIAKITRWLQPTDFEADSSEYNRHLSSQATGTGLWICDTENYRQWHASDKHGSLWIKGVPGSGKSVTAASIAKHLQTTESVPVLTFFFRYIVTTNRTPRNLVRDWLAQLLPFSVSLQHELQLVLQRELDDFSDEQLWEYLQQGLSKMEKVYCLVDALDEMDIDADHGFLNRLNRLATFHPGSTKVLMTSRPKQYLQRALPETSIVHISLEQELVGVDIARFIAFRLESHLPNSETASYRHQATAAILERSGGLFLYARLLLDQINMVLKPENLPNIEDLVSSLPIGLESMYGTMLKQQSSALGVSEEIQRFLLEAATHSARPLRLNELAQALKCSFPDLEISTAKDWVRHACAPLLEIREDETVQIIHHSLTEYLLNKEREDVTRSSDHGRFPVLVSEDAHKRLAMVCLTYLQFSLTNLSRAARRLDESEETKTNRKHARVSSNLVKEDEFDFDHQEARLQYPFLDYAARQWAHHAAKYDFNEPVFVKQITDFLQPDNEACIRWMRLEWDTRRSRTQTPSVLHISAFAGLTSLAKTLDLASMVDSRDGDDRTPLHWASRRGHCSFVELLLEHHADADVIDCNGLRPLHEAAKRNHVSIVKLLLRAGANPVAPKSKENHGWHGMCGSIVTKGETPLQYASSSGYTPTVIAMIPHLDQKQLSEALVRSCMHGRTESVRSLLEGSDVSPNDTFRDGLPLVLAIKALDVASVKLLLHHGADVNALSAWRPQREHSCGGNPRQETARTALHMLVRKWAPDKSQVCLAIFEELIQAGVNLDKKDGKQRTPLENMPGGSHNDVIGPHTVPIQALLQAGATFLDEPRDGVLCRFMNKSADIKVLQEFVNRGASVEHKSPDGSSVLHVALRRRVTRFTKPNTLSEVVQFLMSCGARVEDKDATGKTALAVAAAWGPEELELFKLLLSATSSVAAKSQCIWKLLPWKRSTDVLKDYITTLLEAGVSIDTRDASGRTPLLKNCHSTEIAEILVELGADINAVDASGRGLLHSKTSEESRGPPKPESMQRWLSRGLDIHVVDNEKNNLVHAFAPRWQARPHEVEFVQYLMSEGIKPNARNAKGQTALHLYFLSKVSLGGHFKASHSIAGREIKSGPGLATGHRLARWIDVLRECELDINLQDNAGKTALHLAAKRDAVEFAFLLRYGADIDIIDGNRQTVLHAASAAGQANIVGHILDLTGDRLINLLNKERRTALHLACAAGALETVDILVRRGADVNTHDKHERSPLHACAGSPRHDATPQILDMLIAAGADIKPVGLIHDTALDWAIRSNCKAAVRYFAGKYENVVSISNLPNFLNTSRTTDSEAKKTSALLARTGLLCRTEVLIESLPEKARLDIFKNAYKYIEHFGEQDMSCFVSADDAQTILQSGKLYPGLAQGIAESGRTDLMQHLSSLTRVFDDIDLVRESLKEQKQGSSNYFVDYDPLVATACRRTEPNLLMLRLLVEQHGLNPNAPAYVALGERSASGNLTSDQSPLHVLARAQSWWQLEAYKYLVGKGADIHARDHAGRTPLHAACDEILDWNGHSSDNSNPREELWKQEMVTMLLDDGADPNAVDDSGKTALHYACKSPGIMRTLLERGATLAATQKSPIFTSIQQQNIETLRILLDSGCDANVIDPDQIVNISYKHDKQTRYAIFCACFNGTMNQKKENDVPTALLLLERGARLEDKLANGPTLLHYIFEFAKHEILKGIFDSSHPLDVTLRDQFGRTVLHAACRSAEVRPGFRDAPWDPKDSSVCKLLSYSPAIDLAAVDNDGMNMLHHLFMNIDVEDDVILEVLEHPFCKNLIHAKDANGYTPIQQALKFLRPTSVNTLLDLGADLLAPDPTGSTVLHHIARQFLRRCRPSSAGWSRTDEAPDYATRCFELWKRALSEGADLEHRDGDGNTPLLVYLTQQRVQKRSSENFYIDGKIPGFSCHIDNYDKYFANADSSVRNKTGQSALHIIANREKAEYYYEKGKDAQGKHDAHLFEFMVKKGLDPLDEDEQGRTALDYASAREQKRILELYQYNT